MKIQKPGLDLIKYYEGFSPVVYLCPAGYPTIGYGHVVREGEVFDEPISEEDGVELLASDMGMYESAVERLIAVPLTPGMFDALVSFCYNLGSGSLQISTLRSKLNHGDYDGAAEQFPRWVYARVNGALIKLPGLVKRRNAEMGLFLSDSEVSNEEEGEDEGDEA